MLGECLVLDAGCGSRSCSLSRLPVGSVVVGVDVDWNNMVDSNKWKKRNNYESVNLVCASLTALPFRKKSFDLVVCVDTIEHIDDNEEVFKEFYRVCKMGGSLVGSTTNLMNPILMFDSLAPKRIMEPFVLRYAGEHHYERHSRLPFSKLMRFLRENKFHVQFVRLVGFPPFKPWLYHHFRNKRLPWYAYVWIVLDKITQKKPLNYLKETVVFHAIRK